MRDILDHTLTNPNQCQSFGVSWCDDAWDEHRSLGMQLKDPELLIPFEMNGSFGEFETRTPTKDEIRDIFDDCIVLTDSNSWDTTTERKHKPLNIVLLCAFIPNLCVFILNLSTRSYRS